MCKLSLPRTGLYLFAAAFAISGCASSNVTKITQAAPITHKVGQGPTQSASLPRIAEHNRQFRPRQTAPYLQPPAISAPAQPAPAYPAPAYPAPQPAIPAPSIPEAPRQLPAPVAPRGNSDDGFDQSSVDTYLYKHQRVGQSYTVLGQSYTPKHEPYYDAVGTASWYGDKFHGKPTATGEVFNKNDLTAAHKTLPLNSILHVTNLENGRTLQVRLNDRGPFAGDRIIDLSEASARILGITDQGLARVRVRYAGPADPAFGARPAPSTPQNTPSTPQPAPNTQPYSPAQPQPRPLNPQVPVNPQAPVAPQPSLPPVAELPQQTVPNNRVPDAAPSLPDPIAPQSPQAVAPAAPMGTGEVTLTIKGPIHVAGHDDTMPEPKLITGPAKIK